MKKKIFFSLVTICLVGIFLVIGIKGAKADDSYREPYINEQGQYEISCGGELKWYADRVNEGLQRDVILVNDINISDYEWIPIGKEYNYTNIFDGNDKKITGLNCSYGADDYNQYAALFARNDGTIMNLYVSGTVKSTLNSSGLCGVNYGVIDNCVSAVNVLSESDAAGVCCYNEGTITRVGNEGFVSGVKAAGICLGDGTSAQNLTNAYNVGDIESISTDGITVGIMVESNKEICSVYNIGNVEKPESGYSDELSLDETENSYKQLSEEDIVNGKLAYALNEFSSDENVSWRQILGTDEYPVFYGEIVYYGYEGCGEPVYSNDILSAEPVHDMSTEYAADEYNHFYQCINCDYKEGEEPHSIEGEWLYCDNGYHQNKCIICQFDLKQAHCWSDEMVVTEATKEVVGKKVSTCQQCRAEKTTELLYDDGLPNGQITMESTFFSGLFNGGKRKVSINGKDSLSGVNTIEYSIYCEEIQDFSNRQWTKYKKEFKINVKDTPIVYARITDKCGNYIIINQDNKVVDSGSLSDNKTFSGKIKVAPGNSNQ